MQVQSIRFRNNSSYFELKDLYDWFVSNGRIDLSADTSFLHLPNGTTAERGTTTAGRIRFNTDLQVFEVTQNSNWNEVMVAGVPTANTAYLSLPSGDSSGRTGAPTGSIRFNSNSQVFEVTKNSNWYEVIIAGSPTANSSFISLPSGDNSGRVGAPAGSIRFNSNSNVFEGTVDGVVWSPIAFGTQVARVTLSSTQILALGTSPITIIAAPGVGKAIQVLGCSCSFTFGTIRYTLASGSPGLFYGPIGNNNPADNGILLSGYPITATSPGGISIVEGNAQNGTVSDVPANLENVPLLLGNGTYTLGNGTAVINVTYVILEL